MEEVFIIYIGKRDRRRLFTFTLHFQSAAVVLSVIANVKHINRALLDVPTMVLTCRT